MLLISLDNSFEVILIANSSIAERLAITHTKLAVTTVPAKLISRGKQNSAKPAALLP